MQTLHKGIVMTVRRSTGYKDLLLGKRTELTNESATSSSSVAIGTGSKTFTISLNSATETIPATTIVHIVDGGNSANTMRGVVTSHSGTTMVIYVTSVTGSGTISSWNLSFSKGNGFKGIFDGCFLACYSGTQPASADSAATGTLLFTVTKDADGVTGLTWGAPANGSITNNPAETWQGTGLTTGTIGWCRMYIAGDTPANADSVAAYPRIDFSAGRSGTDAIFSSVDVAVGSPHILQSFTYNM